GGDAGRCDRRRPGAGGDVPGRRRGRGRAAPAAPTAPVAARAHRRSGRGRLPDVRLPARLRLRRQRRRDRHAGPADLLLFRGVWPRTRGCASASSPGPSGGSPGSADPRVRRGRTRPRTTPYDRGMSTRTAFLKGHGTENDFVIVPDPENTVDLPPAAVAALC